MVSLYFRYFDVIKYHQLNNISLMTSEMLYMNSGITLNYPELGGTGIPRETSLAALSNRNWPPSHM